MQSIRARFFSLGALALMGIVLSGLGGVGPATANPPETGLARAQAALTTRDSTPAGPVSLSGDAAVIRQPAACGVGGTFGGSGSVACLELPDGGATTITEPASSASGSTSNR